MNSILIFAAVANGIFSSNMVLQRGEKIPVWGTGTNGEEVVVSFGGETKRCVAQGKQGLWETELGPFDVSTVGRDLKINSTVYTNVLVGDVWHACGQSNMGWCLQATFDWEPFVKEETNRKLLRVRSIGECLTTGPRRDTPKHFTVPTWRPYDGLCPATPFFFSRRVAKETGVPIGVIHSSVGGSAMEVYIPFEFQKEEWYTGEMLKFWKTNRWDTKGGQSQTRMWIRRMRAYLDKMEKDIATDQPPGTGTFRYQMPTLPQAARYNGMIAPWVRLPVKGVIWYQGCNNMPYGFVDLLDGVIDGFRWAHRKADLPFYYVQLAPLGEVEPNPPVATLGNAKRLEQTKALRTRPHLGMALALDCGNVSIHPPEKLHVGERLARWALKNEYGQSDLVTSGPMFKAMKIEGDKVRVSFDSLGSGLMVAKKDHLSNAEPVEQKGAAVPNFRLRDDRGTWHFADAVIDGETVVVSAKGVTKPTAVRYGCFEAMRGQTHLYNREGLPAVEFATDDSPDPMPFKHQQKSK